MGIWRGRSFGRGWFWQDRKGLKAADDGVLTAAAVLDSRIDDWSVMSCRRLTALG
jgi:hypothetical protein